ncbi:hypothetical protein GOBAR_AA19016 [Gossypium barbadense]|uniref:Uncharacterized protein n=2 Tax=Gossypium TaxID=3633 RepID=A0ABM2YKU1_GOSHI|nr:uncharacterized protein LOC107928338 [Gossypium hirsutum]PPS01634.1 hypothetical protein GOBAR_AA19016 [Gossypium barbadense]
MRAKKAWVNPPQTVPFPWDQISQNLIILFVAHLSRNQREKRGVFPFSLRKGIDRPSSRLHLPQTHTAVADEPGIVAKTSESRGMAEWDAGERRAARGLKQQP